MKQWRGDIEHGEVDWELLADHLSGGLAGTPAGARVAELIATDRAWQSAAEQLSTALTAVAAELRALPEPRMPPDVVDRLDAALRSAPAPTRRRPAHTAPVGRPAGSGPAGRSPAPSHPGDDRGARPAPGRRRPHRMAKWGVGLATAAGIVTFTVAGLGWLTERPPSVTSDSGMISNDESAGSAPPAAAAPPEGPPPMRTASGMDYREQTLTGLAVEPTGPSITGGQPGESEPDRTLESAPVPTALPDALARLWSEPQAWADCLAAVAGSFAPTTVTIQSIDFARYHSEPALVMRVTTDDGADWVSVSGAGCGSQQAGADLRFQASLR